MPVINASMNQDDFYQRWTAITPPLRPGVEIVTAMLPLFKGRQGPGLQLGVTPEIADLSSHGIAVDVSETMVRRAWPGDRVMHQAIVGNWLALPFKDASFDIAFGDGCLSMLSWPGEYQLFLQNVERVVRPGGRLLLRCFAGPDVAEPLEALSTAVFTGTIRHFSAFKLRLNMTAFCMAAGGANTSAYIHELFQQHFPDRLHLSQAASWPLSEIGSIDAYASGQSLHTYPTSAQIISLLPANWHYEFIETEGYELAERCPLLVVDFPPA